MRQKKQDSQTLSVGQVAKRWGVATERIRQLLAAGELDGAFSIPSAGRYREAVKIPIAVVEAAEKRWQLMPAQPIENCRPRRKQVSDALKHFPELNLGHAFECPADELH